MTLAFLWPCIAAATAAGALVAALRPGEPASAIFPRGLRLPVRWASAIAALVPLAMPPRLERVFERDLSRAGYREACDPRVWMALLLMSGGFAFAIAGVVAAWTPLPAAFVPCASLIAPVMVHSVLHSRATRRAAALSRDLPAGIDVLVLCMEAGASLGAALRIASEKGGPGPFQSMLGEVIAQIRAGQPRAAALRRVMERIDLPPVSSLFTALIQSETRGMSLGGALRAQSIQCLSDRFVRAERAAMQAPVKLLLPLLTCIFPCTFIVIAVPVAARFIDAGAG
jgi:tight adherence protein C